MKSELIGGIEKREILIADYDASWPEKFELHRGIISAALGATVLRVEHVGSTSVPGLAAKPIIDIILVVRKSADEHAYLPKLEAAGYRLRVREPDWHEHRMLRTPLRDVHVHVYSDGCPEIARNLDFRNRLRTHSQDRQRYEQIKRALARRDWPDMNAYAQAKSEVIESILSAARTPDSVRGAPK
jgi:GrpB-like predicted nucleotidyltransferase (UPF0157 family)